MRSGAGSMRHPRHDGQPSGTATARSCGEAAAAPLAELRGLAERGPVTLLFAARDEAHNSAVVLKAVLEQEPR